jgi:AcrR family transcriptional regulator
VRTIARDHRKSAAEAETPEAPSEGRRERKKRRTLERIIRAARSLFERKGFEATTTQEIAERADIGTGTLFNYAKTKEELLLMVFRDDMMPLVEDAFATAPKRAPLLDQIVHYFDCFIAYHRRDIKIAKVLIRELSSVHSPEQREKNREFVRFLVGRIADLVRAAQARGELRPDVPPLTLAHNLFAVYYRLLQNWLGEYITLDRYERRIRQALELQLRGFLIEGTEAAPPRKTSARRSR